MIGSSTSQSSLSLPCPSLKESSCPSQATLLRPDQTRPGQGAQRARFSPELALPFGIHGGVGLAAEVPGEVPGVGDSANDAVP